MPIYPKNFFEDQAIQINTGSCFVIMPFKEDFDELYEEVLKECLEENKFNVIRADEIYGTKSIMEDILYNIGSSEVIIADLTGKNPNVLYELGIAHTRKDNDKVVIICQDMKDVPFDLRHLRILQYKMSIAGAKALKKQLSKTLKDIRLIPFNCMGFCWKPKTSSWFISDENNLRGEIVFKEEVPLIFNEINLQKPQLQISFTAISDGPEVNVMFYADGSERYSGYHFWFWKGGAKLRRVDSEVILKTDYKLKNYFPHEIIIFYNNGEITVIIDSNKVLEFTDQQPLHVKTRLKHMGFNISSGTGGVLFSELKIDKDISY